MTNFDVKTVDDLEKEYREKWPEGYDKAYKEAYDKIYAVAYDEVYLEAARKGRKIAKKYAKNLTVDIMANIMNADDFTVYVPYYYKDINKWLKKAEKKGEL